jgi:hypothetical protein
MRLVSAEATHGACSRYIQAALSLLDYPNLPETKRLTLANSVEQHRAWVQYLAAELGAAGRIPEPPRPASWGSVVWDDDASCEQSIDEERDSLQRTLQHLRNDASTHIEQYNAFTEAYKGSTYHWPLNPERYPKRIREGDVVLLLAGDGSEPLAVVLGLRGDRCVVARVRPGGHTDSMREGQGSRSMVLEGWTTASSPPACYEYGNVMEWPVGRIAAKVGSVPERLLSRFLIHDYMGDMRRYVRQANTDTARAIQFSSEAYRPTAPGDVYWAEVPWSEGGGSKDRPVVVLRAWDDWVSVLKVTSQDHTAMGSQFELHGLGWNNSGKNSFVDLSRSIPLHTSLLRRREGTLAPAIFAAILSRAPQRDV